MANASHPDSRTILELSTSGLWASAILATGFTSLGIVTLLKTENAAGSLSKLFERLHSNAQDGSSDAGDHRNARAPTAPVPGKAGRLKRRTA